VNDIQMGSERGESAKEKGKRWKKRKRNVKWKNL
jgi:uncharacterized protein (DUF1919 family)